MISPRLTISAEERDRVLEWAPLACDGMGDSTNKPGTPPGYVMVEKEGMVFGGCMVRDVLLGAGVKYVPDAIAAKRAGEVGSESLVAVERCPEETYYIVSACQYTSQRLTDSASLSATATLLPRLTLLIPLCNLCCSKTAANDILMSSISLGPMPSCV